MPASPAALAQDNPLPWRVTDRDGVEPRQTDALVWIMDANGNRVAQWVPIAAARAIVAAMNGAEAA